MQKPIFVIGSNSFSGANFSRYCLQHNIRVIGISRSAEPDAVFLPYKWIDHQNFQFHQCDLNKDLESIFKLIAELQPDYIVNFAAQSMVAQSWEHPEHWMQTNVVANAKLHSYLKDCKWLKKYVHVSTPEVYGSCSDYIVENENYHPSTPYAVSRAACDMNLRTLIDNYNFPCVFTRAANVYGAGQQLYRIIPKTILSIRMGAKLNLHGGGVSRRSFIHMDDVSHATLKIMKLAPPGNIYHIATENDISIRDLVATICSAMGVAFDHSVDAAPERSGKDQAYLLNSKKIRTSLDWRDEITLSDGIQSVIGWIDKNFATLQRANHEYIHKQ